ncbi:DUF2066 domain-containing protein [Nitratireductor soli]|uniref:DUF2066 domain-containing protein n=1 Tax=Nitratireductor soli TaxID=1670619 RepID=UPI00065E5380|nr:DUF2066 domain-containing protein [Nitratireductor soli]
MTFCFDRRLWFALLVCLATSCPATAEDNHAALYRAVTIVTGTDEPERSRGFAACMREVLVKLSGDPALTSAPGMDDLAGRAGDFVTAFDYRDRMAGIPVHDEQGTRERPHYLAVEFSPPKIDAALRGLGGKPWLDRPVLSLDITVDNGARKFPLVRDGAFGRDQRAALIESAERLGLPISFPEAQRTSEAEPVLTGALTWHPDKLEWSSRWSLALADQPRRWVATASSFDAVFRDALGRAVADLVAEAQP